MSHTTDIQPGLVRRMHANYRETWRYYARTLATGAIEERPGLTCVATGIPEAWFNICFLTEEARDIPGAIDHARRFFEQRGVPWLMRAEGETAACLKPSALDAGLVRGEPVPGMLLPRLTGELSLPSGLTVREVDSLDLLRSFNDTCAAGFGISSEFFAAWDSPSMYRDLDATLYLGFVDERPVATALRYTSHRIAGVHNVATLPEYRGRGIGEAMTWSAALGGREEGCIASALQASAMGLPVYQRMGYRHVVDYQTWDMPA
jgi:GNAT superfamily N-acetyltransferase